MVGLATALSVQSMRPSASICLLDKEDGVARHQSSRNSGVIHAGVYYKPGSLKARLCVDGAARMRRFCREENIPMEQCGKVIVATGEGELPALRELERRARANGLSGLRWLDHRGVVELEPHVRGVAGLLVPETAIVDYSVVAARIAARVQAQGAEVKLGWRVVRGRPTDDGAELTCAQGDVAATHVVNCAGLHADVVARALGCLSRCLIVPFRGEYLYLRPEAARAFSHLIYPVPDPRMPFLGVHLTRRIDGSVEAGPNAVLAWAREGYRGSEFSWDVLGYAGRREFWRMAHRYWRSGVYEQYRSWSRGVFLRDLQRLAPDIDAADLTAGGAGVRAQAVREDGTLVQDFWIEEGPSITHVLNAPSPAATASLSIGEYLARLATKTMGGERQ